MSNPCAWTIAELLPNAQYKYLICQVFILPFHGSNRGSNPRGDATSQINDLAHFRSNIRDLSTPGNSLEYPAISRVFPIHPESIAELLPNSPAGFDLTSFIQSNLVGLRFAPTGGSS